MLFSTVYDGAARAARDWFVKFLRERAPSNLGAPLATLPRMQEAVGEIDSALYASRILLASIAERVDRGDTPHPQESLYVKHNVTKNALDGGVEGDGAHAAIPASRRPTRSSGITATCSAPASTRRRTTRFSSAAAGSRSPTIPPPLKLANGAHHDHRADDAKSATRRRFLVQRRGARRRRARSASPPAKASR